MNLSKMKQQHFIKLFTITMLSIFVVGILSTPALSSQNAEITQALSIIDDEDLAEINHLAQLDIPPEEKTEMISAIIPNASCTDLLLWGFVADALGMYSLGSLLIDLGILCLFV